MTDDKAEQFLKRFERVQILRSPNEWLWQELKDLVRPNAQDFNRTAFAGQSRVDRIFDGTAPKALGELASALDSDLTSATTRWFFVTHPDKDILEDDECLLWLEIVSDIMYAHYSYAETNFNPSMHEGFLDLGAFGTDVVYQDRDAATGIPMFRVYPLASCWILENSSGKIDTVYRQEIFSTRQAIQEFGDRLPAKIAEEKDLEKMHTFVHGVYPRNERDPQKLDNKNMPFESCWVSKEHRCVVRESGYKENPYHVSRWYKTAGEIYGRSPAMDCLPDIRMLNTMSKTLIRSAQKIVDPPIICDDDGVLLPLKTFPGAVILKTPGADKPEPLLTGGRVDIGLDMMDQRRDFIMRCFFIDNIRRQQKKERQSQMEIQDERGEMYRAMGSHIGRIYAEKLRPILKRTFNMLMADGKFPKTPRKMLARGKKVEVTFISPAARAQSTFKITALQQALNDIGVFANINPAILDVVNTDKAAQQIFTLRDVSRVVMNTPEQIDQIRQQRSQAQQLSQGAELGATAAGGIKDLATAQAMMAKARSQ